MTNTPDPHGDKTTSSSDPYADMMKMWQPLLDIVGGEQPGLIDGVEIDTDSLGGNAKELVTVMASIFKSGVTSSFQSWTRMAEANIRYMPVIAERMAKVNSGGESEDHSRALLVDASRTWMREINDISQQEARKFHTEVEALLEHTVLGGVDKPATGEQKRQGHPIE